tara:strand:- start:87290 stop:87616 length:327 start_codon:yes stop_codon:yes gene_type:complete
MSIKQQSTKYFYKILSEKNNFYNHKVLSRITPYEFKNLKGDKEDVSYGRFVLDEYIYFDDAYKDHWINELKKSTDEFDLKMIIQNRNESINKIINNNNNNDNENKNQK